MRLTKWMPEPLRTFVRKRMTIFVYTYGFRPSPIVEEQLLTFRVSGRALQVKADYRTALYDMIAEVVDYDAYQLKRIPWRPNAARHIIDIGANVGVTALALSQISGANVTCFEPDPGNCKQLLHNLELNGLTNVKVVQAAVTNRNGTTEFHVDEQSTGGHVTNERSAPKGTKISVPAVTLEKAIEQCGSPTVDLLKCDCEGGEYDITDQLTPQLASRVRNLTLEVHDLDQDRNVQRISAHLSSLGYQLSCKPDMWDRSALHLLLASRPG